MEFISPLNFGIRGPFQVWSLGVVERSAETCAMNKLNHGYDIYGCPQVEQYDKCFAYILLIYDI